MYKQRIELGITCGAHCRVKFVISLALKTIWREGSIQDTVCQPQNAVNMFAACDTCLQAADKHFQHLLQTW